MSITIGAIAAARRPKWQYPPPAPTPRILHLPRRPRRKTHKNVPGKPSLSEVRKDRKGKLETLFDQERVFRGGSVPIVLLEGGDCERRRERVGERENCGGGLALEEEKWRFQAEMLRAECNLLRMEKEIAVKKMERTKVKAERALRSAIQILFCERKKISEGNDVKVVLEDEIQHLAEKLEKLRRNLEAKNLGVRRYNNFDKQAAHLQRQMKMFRGTSDEVCVRKIQEIAEVSLSIKSNARGNESLVPSDSSNVEILRRKMEGLSSGMLLERMKEECGSMLSTANCSVASSASTSQRIEFTDSSPVEQSHKERASREENLCSGRCKAIVQRILEQVRAETEQWSQMQEMLGQVREEIEELQASRDFWEDRALDYDFQMQYLQSNVQEWRQKATSSESKANQLEAQMYLLRRELERLQREEKINAARAKAVHLASCEGENEMEKRVLVCRLKENHHSSESNPGKPKEVSKLDGNRRKTSTRSSGLVEAGRSPLQDISNSSGTIRQKSAQCLPGQARTFR
ncbi:hypothetical protein UlMin_030278 [Ulmus minor]